MAKQKAFEKELDLLVTYIKENMANDDDWVVVKYRDVPQITGASSYYVRKLFEMLKDHPNILFEIDKNAKTNKKPLRFKYTSKEEKLAHVLSEESFYYLNEEEIDHIKSNLSIKDYESLFKHVNLCNFIASMGAKESPVLINIKEISDIMVESYKECEQMVNNLQDSEILVDTGGHFILSLSSTDQQINPKTNKDAGQKKPTFFDSDKLSQKVDELYDSSPTQPSAMEGHLTEDNTLTDNLKTFYDSINAMQSEFSAFLKHEVDRAIEAEDREEQMNDGYEAMQRLISENEELTQKNKDLQDKNKSLKKKLDVSQKFHERFTEHAESRLEIMLAEIVGVVSNYTQVPSWQKDQSHNAKLNKDILNAVTSAVDDMINMER